MKVDRASIVQESPTITSAARWLWWVAGLSLINTIVTISGTDLGFQLGMGITQITDAMLVEEYLSAALVIDVVVIGFLFAMGWLAQKGHLIGFILGGGLYLLDMVVYLLCAYFMPILAGIVLIPVLLHGYVLYRLFQGGRELSELIHEVKHALREAQESDPDYRAPGDPPYIL